MESTKYEATIGFLAIFSLTPHLLLNFSSNILQEGYEMLVLILTRSEGNMRPGWGFKQYFTNGRSRYNLLSQHLQLNFSSNILQIEYQMLVLIHIE